MKLRWLSVIGGFFLLTATGLGAAMAVAGAISFTEVTTALALATVGVLFVLAGEGRDAFGLTWYQFGGTGQVVLGCWFAFQAGTFVPDDPGSVELIMAAAFALSGLVFVFIGIDWVRGGLHFDVSGLDPGPLRDDATAGE